MLVISVQPRLRILSYDFAPSRLFTQLVKMPTVPMLLASESIWFRHDQIAILYKKTTCCPALQGH